MDPSLRRRPSGAVVRWWRGHRVGGWGADRTRLPLASRSAPGPACVPFEQLFDGTARRYADGAPVKRAARISSRPARRPDGQEAAGELLGLHAPLGLGVEAASVAVSSRSATTTSASATSGCRSRAPSRATGATMNAGNTPSSSSTGTRPALLASPDVAVASPAKQRPPPPPRSPPPPPLRRSRGGRGPSGRRSRAPRARRAAAEVLVDAERLRSTDSFPASQSIPFGSGSGGRSSARTNSASVALAVVGSSHVRPLSRSSSRTRW
jgi:hypothetical protein